MCLVADKRWRTVIHSLKSLLAVEEYYTPVVLFKYAVRGGSNFVFCGGDA